MNKFRVVYDTGPNDEGFWECWTVTNDERSFRVDSSRQDAEWLADALKAPPAAEVPAGYSLRDYFAAKAMQGMLAAAEPYNTGELAMYAYEVADAMLAAAERRGVGNDHA